MQENQKGQTETQTNAGGKNAARNPRGSLQMVITVVVCVAALMALVFREPMLAAWEQAAAEVETKAEAHQESEEAKKAADDAASASKAESVAASNTVATADVELPDAPIDPTADWAQYDELIADIKSETDFAARAEKMHRAEDMLMSTGALIPLYYYNDVYLQKEAVAGAYSNNYGFKYFMYATNGNATNMNLCLASEPDYMDPALNNSVDTGCMVVNTFAGLYSYAADGSIVPNLADGYEVSADGLTYTFTLKDGLKWSDGTPITANDFVYSWKRAVAPETVADYFFMFNGIDGYQEGNLNVTALDDTTLKVVLYAPCAYFLDLMCFPTFFPVQEACVTARSSYAQPGSWAYEAGYVTSGAYTVTAWNHNASITLTKNPYYWDAENVKLETLTFLLSDDDNAVYDAYRSGMLDFIDSVPADEIAGLIERQDPEFHIVDQLGTYYLVFNVKSPLFEGKTVEQAAAMRQAFSYLVDRDYIVKNIGRTGQQVATTFIPAGMADGNGGIFKSTDYFNPGVDVEKAQALLEYAGFKFTDDGMLSNETPISFEYLTNTTSGHVAIAEAIQADLSEVGINMTIKQEDWNIFLEDRKAGYYDVARNGWIADFNDPINMLEMWTTESGNNDVQFGR